MKKALKYVLYGVVSIVLIISVSIFYIKNFLPNIAVQDIAVEITPERIERGDYLANHVTLYMDCHAERDWTKFAGPIAPGTAGAGGDRFDRTMGFPGVYYSPNITPFNLHEWTDGDIFRAITSGVKKNGDPIFPVMPFLWYAKMDKEDIYSIIAYLITLKPRENMVEKSETDFPMSIIMHMIPKEPTLSDMPDKSNKMEYGKYLAQAAACVECHTPAEKGVLDENMYYAGGR